MANNNCSSSNATVKHDGNHKPCKIYVRIRLFLAAKSPNTQRQYIQIINDWSQFIGTEWPKNQNNYEYAARLAAATDEDALKYYELLRQRIGERGRMDNRRTAITPQTIARYIWVLRAVYNILLESGLISFNPFKFIDLPTSRAYKLKRPTEMLDFELVEPMINLPDTSNPRGIRDRAILAVLFNAGIRRGELCKLTCNDVIRHVVKRPVVIEGRIELQDIATMGIRVIGRKTHRDDDIALASWCEEILGAHLKQRYRDGATNDSILFPNYKWERRIEAPILERQLYRIITGYADQLTDAHISPHSTRATAISKLFEDGERIEKIQKFSGHESLKSVVRYDKRETTLDKCSGKKIFYDTSFSVARGDRKE